MLILPSLVDHRQEVRCALDAVDGRLGIGPFDKQTVGQCIGVRWPGEQQAVAGRLGLMVRCIPEFRLVVLE